MWTALRLPAVVALVLATPVACTQCGRETAGDNPEADLTAPEVLFTSPINGAHAVAPNVSIFVAFTERVHAGTLDTSSLRLEDGTGTAVTGTVVPAASGARFTPDAALAYETTYTARVTTAVMDLAGNALSADVVWSFVTSNTPDITAPTVFFTDPPAGTASVVTQPTLRVAFDEAIDPTTLTPASFMLEDASGAAVVGTVTVAATGGSWVPAAPLALDTLHTASVTTGITDLAGNPLAAPVHWTFTIRSGVWQTAALLENRPGTVSEPTVVVDSSGAAFAIWRQDNGRYDDIYAARYTISGDWGVPELLDSGGFSATRPSVAQSGAVNATAVWDQSDGSIPQVWTARYAARDGWAAATRLTTVEAVAAEVAADAMGNAVTAWMQRDGSQFSIWASSFTPAQGWSRTQSIDTTTAGGSNDPQVAMSATGVAFVVWRRTNQLWANRHDPAAAWSEPFLHEPDMVVSSSRASVAADASGNAMAAWLQFNGSRSTVRARRFIANLGWDRAVLVDNGENSAAQQRVAMDELGTAVAVWVSNGAQKDVWANVYNPGRGWGSATLLESGNGDAAAPDVAASNGQAVVVWHQVTGSVSGIWSNNYVPGTGWGVATLLEANAAGPAVSPRVGMDARGNAVVVWVQPSNGDSSMWATRRD